MKCKGIFAFGVLSLFLVGASGKAAWASGTGETKAQDTKAFEAGDGHVRIFGKTFCATDAPAIVDCDWRMPKASSDPPAVTRAKKVNILGKNICFGPTEDDSCWLRFPAAEQQHQRRASL